MDLEPHLRFTKKCDPLTTLVTDITIAQVFV